MSSAEMELENRLAEMRRLFDQSFAAEGQVEAAAKEQMIAIKAGGEDFAVRLRDVSGLAVSKGKILPVPSRVAELLGITGIRGMVVPVFSLAALLASPPAATPPRWLMFCGGKQAPIALAFDDVEGHFAAASTDIYQGDTERGYVTETARDGVRLRSVLAVARIVDYITQRKPSGS